MQLEIKEWEQHGTWTVVPREYFPATVNVVPSSWAFKVKIYPDGRLRNFKAIFCARGDRQVEGIDCFEKYAPFVSWTTVQLMIILSIN
jgi:hypothetical protein